ncbi:MAG: WbqC family protein [Capnocytophaga granulosa]
MKALLHPTYFPTIASFSLLVKESCLLEVSDNYQKQTYRNRTYIYGANGKQILTVPILHTGGETGRQLYKDVRVDNQVAWQKLHWKTLQTAYRTSPYFEYYEDKIVPIFTQKPIFLLDLNFRTIEAVLDCLHIDVSWEQTTAYQTTYEGVTDYRYLTNAKASYEVNQAPYYQIFSDKHGFIPNLSILDLLFHEGNRLMTSD